jgi:transposase-like protein
MLKCPKCNSLNVRLLVDHKKGERGKEYHCAGCDSRLMEDVSYRRTVVTQREQMVALRKEGLSKRGIARALRCSLTTVIYHLKKSTPLPSEPTNGTSNGAARKPSNA